MTTCAFPCNNTQVDEEISHLVHFINAMDNPPYACAPQGASRSPWLRGKQEGSSTRPGKRAKRFTRLHGPRIHLPIKLHLWSLTDNLHHARPSQRGTTVLMVRRKRKHHLGNPQLFTRNRRSPRIAHTRNLPGKNQPSSLRTTHEIRKKRTSSVIVSSH